MGLLTAYESLTPNEQWCVILVVGLALLAFITAVNEREGA